MAPEQPAIIGTEIALAQLGISEDLEGALVIEVADNRGDHAVLPEQKTHGLERAPNLLFEFDELAQLVVAVDDVDQHVLVEGLFPLHAQFARVSVSDGETVPAGKELAKH